MNPSLDGLCHPSSRVSRRCQPADVAHPPSSLPTRFIYPSLSSPTSSQPHLLNHHAYPTAITTTPTESLHPIKPATSATPIHHQVFIPSPPSWNHANQWPDINHLTATSRHPSRIRYPSRTPAAAPLIS
ncbi:hypothetical protein EX30DRAFT_340148 [Ascodesmis nigricans]|uniref:Uncharacterized protein n=1 Tax=Ascodesmis nigricans TaxID=341454 RepID=A0A4S2MZP9_9PEZI|nr:hypothetical protein EX30DRAFT_340148 [Ascodesmis nigricans]